MTLRVRELDEGELEAAWRLGGLTFGGPGGVPTPQALQPAVGFTRYGAFDERDALVGRAGDLHHEQWWGGLVLPTADVGGVAVLPEARGAGVGRALIQALVQAAHERGALVSALYPTVAAPYRRWGWDVVGSLRSVTLPADALRAAGRALPDDAVLRTRPGTAPDLAAVRAVYDQVAVENNGMLTRRGSLFASDADALPEGVDGVTLVEDDEGTLLAYATYARGPGYRDDAVLTVLDCFSLRADAGRRLLAVLGSWSSVTPTVSLRTIEGDGIGPLLPADLLHHSDARPWMHRPIDIAGAVSRRGWPRHVTGEADFTFDDVLAPWNSGTWHLRVADGSGELARTNVADASRLTVRGFSLLYAGAATVSSLRRSGLVDGDDGALARLDVLGSGPRAQLLDYF